MTDIPPALLKILHDNNLVTSEEAMNMLGANNRQRMHAILNKKNVRHVTVSIYWKDDLLITPRMLRSKTK